MSKLGSSQYIQDAVKEMFNDFKTDRRGFIFGSLTIMGSILSALAIGVTYRSKVLNEPIEGPFFRRKTGVKFTVYTRTDGNEDLSKPIKYLDAENVWESDFVEDMAFSKRYVVVKVKSNGGKKAVKGFYRYCPICGNLTFAFDGREIECLKCANRFDGETGWGTTTHVGLMRANVEYDESAG
ncbi:MAG: hypothetical protein HZC10_02620 [Nitrospirae bacterium]|nr:hypothetical protein [Nitrospirota bacterium]